MSHPWRKLTERVFGPAAEPGGDGAGVQLWWRLPEGGVDAIAVSLEVLQGPSTGRRYAWALQSGVVDAGGARVGEVLVSLVAEAGEWRWELPRSGDVVPTGGRGPWRLQVGLTAGAVRATVASTDGTPCSSVLAVAATAVGLADVAVALELAEPPDDPTTVTRWSALSRSSAGRREAVAAVLLTLPTTSRWRRIDVVTDDDGVLMVTNTRRRARNLSVLALPTAR